MICYCCDPSNPDRIATHHGRETTLRVPERFEGPPGSVNGGMAVGILGCPALHAAELDGIEAPTVTRITSRLQRSMPHSRDIEARTVAVDGAYDVDVHDDAGGTVSGRVEVAARAKATEREQLVEVPPEMDALLVEMGRVREPSSRPFFEETGDHPISVCFSCGPNNPRGLQIFPRFVDPRAGVTWASWSPDASFVDGGGALASSIVASALDCSSGICLPREQQEELLRTDQFYLLGSFDVRYLRLAASAARYHVVAKARRREGRKFYGTSALFDEAGTPYAIAEAIWIVVQMTRAQAFG